MAEVVEVLQVFIFANVEAVIA